MNLILLGAPGAGKGTQAELLVHKLSIPAISTGNMLREAIANGTELGKKAKAYMDAGNLVPDDVTVRLVESRLEEDDAKAGFLLDGFPRTVPQADELERILRGLGLDLDGVVQFDVSEDVVVERMLARGRADDTEDVIRNRMQVYARETAPLLDHYADKVIKIQAEGTVEEINAATMAELDKLK